MALGDMTQTMTRLCRSISLLLVFFAALAAPGQDAVDLSAAGPLSQQMTRRGVQVTLEVSAGAISTADRLRLTLRVATPIGAKVRWPDLAEQLGVFLITGDHREPTWLDSRDRFVTERTLTLEPMLAGPQAIPALRFDLQSASGEPDQILTDPVAIAVTSLLPEAETEAEKAAGDLSEIRSIVEPTSPTPAWLWGLLVLVLLGGVGLTVFFVQKRRHRPQIAAPADQVALAALENLLRSGLLEGRQWDAFFSQLSTILRRYIEARFDLHAPQRSTEEFLREARGAALLGPEQVEELDRFLHRADLVKFAAAQVNGAEAKEAAEGVRAFIADTRSIATNGEGA